MKRIAAAVLGLALGAVVPSLALAADPAPKDATPKAAPSATVPGAPFGLEWGLSKEEVEAKGVKLTPTQSSEGGRRFTATGLSKLIADVGSVVLDFGFDNALWKVAALSDDYPNDPYGFKVRSRYDELNGLLAQKYGRGKATHHTGGSIYAEPKNFIYGIKSGNNWHYTDYSANSLNIEISVRAKDSDTGYFVLIYTNTELEKGFEKAKAAHEKGAL